MSTRMLQACNHSEYELLQSMIDEGQNINHVWPGGLTLLHVAVGHGDVRSVEMLLDAGALVDAPTADGKTPLILAAEGGYRLVIASLRRRKADVNASTHRGNTALHLAVANRHFDCACQLLWMGARSSLRNAHGLRAEDMTPLIQQPADLVDLFRAARLRERRSSQSS